MTESEDIIFKKFKDEQVVEFNVVNNTSSNITLDLFNLATLSNAPTSTTSTAPNIQTNVNSIVGINYWGIEVNPLNGELWMSSTGGQQILVYDSTGTTGIISIGLLSQPSSITYCSANNTMYVNSYNSNVCYVIDCVTYIILTTIIGFAGNLIGGSKYCPTTNQVYVGTSVLGTPTQVIDCATNLIVASPVTPASQSQSFAYNPINNSMYTALLGTTTIGIYDCSTNLLSSTIATINQPYSVVYCSANNCIYVGYNNANVIDVIDCNSNTIISTITFGGLVSTIFMGTYSASFGIIYFLDINNNVIYVVDVNNNTISSTIIPTIPFSNLYSVIGYNPISNLLFVGNATSLFTFGTSYYILGTGASNYNFFLQNLENEPIKVYYVRVISSQTQLSNVAQITEIDANGNEKQLPHFPILGVSAFQEQGNIGFIDFKGKLILDGRTYLSNYILNANESVIFEIHYTQLNRDAIKSIFSKILPKKTPLKGFFDDYVEM